MNNKIFKKYTNPSFPSSFSGSSLFFNELKKTDKSLKKNQVEKILNKHEVYSLHRPARKNFKRSQVIVSGIDDTWQIDLVDMSDFARENKGYRYILTVIDVFSKYAWAIPIKKKDQHSVTDAFKKVLSNRSPRKIQADKGKEFYNVTFKNLLAKYDTKLYSTFSALKASVVERFNRTLKQKMWRMFTLNKNHKYIDNLNKLIQSYNNSYHRSIKTKPINVNKNNEKDVWQVLYGYDNEKDLIDSDFKKLKLQVGDLVRISELKKTFSKGYTQNWTNEIFIIYKVYDLNPIVYRIKDLKSEIVEGYFYFEELQKVDKSIFPYDIFVIDKVWNTRTNKNNIKEKLVSFIGKKDKEWIREDQIDKHE